MRVMHLLASNKFSGAENVVCQIIKNVKGCDCVYVSPQGPIAERLKEEGIEFFPLEKLSAKEVKRAIKTIKPSIIHAHDFRASVISAFVAKKIPVISHLHNNSPWLKKRGIFTFLYANSCKKYKKILTVSNSVFDEFIYGEKFKDKLLVVGNPVNITPVRHKAGDIPTDKEFEVCFLGRLTEQKQPLLFLEIIAKLKETKPQIKAIMIGDGELREQVEQKIQELSLCDNVSLTGFLTNPYEVMKKCKILLMPSAWEGFGLAAVEAMALGMPVVCSGVGGLPLIVEEKCGKICKNCDEYVEEVNLLLENDEYCLSKSKSALLKAVKMNNSEWYFDNVAKEYSLICEVKNG